MLATACGEASIDLVIFDNELTPAQLRNLEEALDRKVVDRRNRSWTSSRAARERAKASSRSSSRSSNT